MASPAPFNRLFPRGTSPNPWKLSTFVLVAALAVVVGGQHVATAEAAGPMRLSKALSALRASKKLLDDAKDPPAPFHQQSLVVVGQAIAAVEREIKAYETAKAKEKSDGQKGDAHKDKKDEKAKKDGDSSKKSAVAASANAKKKPAADSVEE